jgi:hypothetical protein
MMCQVQEFCGFSGTSLSLSAMRPSSRSERGFIFRMSRLRLTFRLLGNAERRQFVCSGGPARRES